MFVAHNEYVCDVAYRWRLKGAEGDGATLPVINPRPALI